VTPTATPATETTSAAPATTEAASEENLNTSALEAASNLAAGNQLEETIQTLMAFGGHSRDMVERAMRAAFNNPDRAAEYLMTGIPENIAAEEAAAETDVDGVAPMDEGADEEALIGAPDGADVEGADGADPLAFLRADPQFNQIRALVQQRPEVLPPLLQQLQQQNPELLAIINQNQEAFLALLNEPVGAVPGGGDGGAPPGEGAPGERVIQVTPEERASIERLVALGFSPAECIQALRACDGNEALAANLLLNDI
jgi:UV excision repair protein RAD23